MHEDDSCTFTSLWMLKIKSILNNCGLYIHIIGRFQYMSSLGEITSYTLHDIMISYHSSLAL